jgi:alginate O-acetyltransferase complex protein AlgJ
MSITPENQGIVQAGDDDWLFLVGGSNNVEALFARESSFTPAKCHAWVQLLMGRQARLAESGIRYLHLPAPEKLTVYPEFFRGEIPNPQGSPTRALFSRLPNDQNVAVNPLIYFDQVKHKRQLYWKTDTHWSFYGAFSAYQLLCNKLGIEPNPALVSYPRRNANVVMDLGAKMSPPQRETITFFRLQKNSRRVFANELVQFKERYGFDNTGALHVGSHVVFQNDSPSAVDKKLILFGDSFSEYRPSLLTGMLAETVRELHFIWGAELDYQYIAEQKPDIVVSELAERFMTVLPRDERNNANFSKQRISAYIETHGQPAEPVSAVPA